MWDIQKGLEVIVEKNEDGDQKIEQDGIKPEDKAHKAATKIQASFRGHITRKKLKGEKKGDAPASESDAADKKEDGPAGGAAENKESEARLLPPQKQPPLTVPSWRRAAKTAARQQRRRKGMEPPTRAQSSQPHRLPLLLPPRRKSPLLLPKRKVPLKLPLITRRP
ncbi:growth associated protein 43 [Columba livia]|uniref:Neuromodulin n=1 Tax=Columba livia TaxID=8932 RepID=A0A2I0MS56_COLLI|nr:growth associated protein 43 [Columba livia]